MKRSKPIIGLAGGIGSGKSAAAGILDSLGAAVVDSDRLSHQQLEDPAVCAALRTWWGESIFLPNGVVDRGAVAAIVFDQPAKLRRLEELLYPRIHRRREELVAAYNADPAVLAIVFDAPKLYEAGLRDLCDVVIFVEAEWSHRVQRVAAQRGWTEAELRKRENLQIPLDTKRANADYVVTNHTSVDELRPPIVRIFDSVLATFA